MKLKRPRIDSNHPSVRMVDMDAEVIEGQLDISVFDEIKDDLIGAMPMETEQMEKFCQLIAIQQLSATRAYTEAYNSKGTRKTCERHAMKLKKRDDIKARVDFLGGKVEEVTDHPAELREAIKLCSTTMRRGNIQIADRMAALDRLAKLLGWYNVKGGAGGKMDKPDPAWFASYVQEIGHDKHLASNPPTE